MQNRSCFVMMILGGSAALGLGLSGHFWFLPKLRTLASSHIAFGLEHRMEAYHRQFGAWPEGGNTDILLALRGQNPGQTIFMREEEGFKIVANQIVDEWKTPLAFIRQPDGRPKPVSAGPNKRHGDDDDVDATLARQDVIKVHGEGKIPPFEPLKPKEAPATVPVPATAPATPSSPPTTNVP